MGPSPGAGEEEVQLRNRQHEIVADLGRRALAGDDPDWLMHDAAAVLADTLDAAYVGIFTLTRDGDRLQLREGVGWREGEGPEDGPSHREHLGGPVLAQGRAVVFGAAEEPIPHTDRLVRHGVETGIADLIDEAERVEPDPEAMFHHVYAERTPRIRAQQAQLRELRERYGDDELCRDE